MPIGVFSHNHKQETAATEWTIKHNLGTRAPVVDVFIDHEGTTQKIIPHKVEVVDDVTVKVVFTTARSGVAAVR